jgi:serine/threonine-protein kinase
LGTYTDGRPFYAMRFIRGESLKEAIDRFRGDEALKKDTGRRSIELRRLLGRFLDVCNAIEYAHSRGVLHRDIKPGNIVVGKHGETLVVDWGLAKATGRAEPGAGERTLLPSSASGSAETSPGSALGTPAYMSPEQAEGHLERLGPRSDIYSLGATLYCLLTGKPRLDGDDMGELIRRVQRGDFPTPRQVAPSIDPALEAVCLKAMALRPEDRYASSRQLANDLERWMADEPVTAYREPFWRQGRRWAKRNRTAVAAAAVALLAGVVGLAAVTVVQTQAKAEISQALDRETRANIEMARSKGAVQTRYDLAVEAIKTFHTGVSEDFLLKHEQFKELRDRLLKSASDFYGKLSALLGEETDLASRRALAASNFELAELTSKVGRREDALAAHRAVLAEREVLAAEQEFDVRAKVDVGRSLTEVARLLQATGKTEEALETYRRSESLLAGIAGTDAVVRAALADCRSSLGSLHYARGQSVDALATFRLARADQEVLVTIPWATNAARRDLAATISHIGILLSDTGKPSEAEAEFRNALLIEQKLTDENPADPGFRSRLAAGHYNLAMLLSDAGKAAEAEREHQTALAIRQKLADENPAVTEFRRGLANCHTNLGVLLSDTGKATEAAAEHRAALAIQQKLAEAEPGNPTWQRDVGRSLTNLGELDTVGGRLDAAITRFRASTTIHELLVRDHPTLTDYRSGLAFALTGLGRALHRAGRSAEAVEPLRRAVALREAIATLRLEARYDLARSYALLASAAIDPRSGRSAADAGAEADRATAALTQAIAAGFRDLGKLRVDPDLAPLRGRDDFTLLMLDLAFPDAPIARGD